MPASLEGALDQAAEPAGVRPRVEAAAGAQRALGDPHLLDRRPPVRPPAPEEMARRVLAHERLVHLEPAPVRIPRVPPRALVALEAPPRALVRRIVRATLR